VFVETGLSTAAIEQMTSLGKSLSGKVTALSESMIARFNALDELMVRTGQPSLKLIPGVMEFSEERMNIFLTSKSDPSLSDTTLEISIKLKSCTNRPGTEDQS